MARKDIQTMPNIVYRNQELHDSLSAYTSRALEMLSAEVDPSRKPQLEETCWVPHEEHVFKRVQETRAQWSFTIASNYAALKKLPEYQDAHRALYAEPAVASQLDTLVGTCREMMRVEAEQIINAILFKIADQSGALAFDTEIFDAEYSRLEEFFWSDRIQYERFNVLYGFKAPNDVALGEDLAIVRLSDPEVCKMLDLGLPMGHGMGSFTISVARFAIRTRLTLPKLVGEARDNDDQLRANEVIHRIDQREAYLIKILRLFKTGPVYSTATLQFRDSFVSSGVIFGTNRQPRISDHNKYELSKQELPQLRKLWHQSNNPESTKKRHFLSVALRRFSQAKDRVDPEDTVIDLFICAEALFLSEMNTDRGEMRYRLSHRAALFVEAHATTRTTAFRFMKKMYDVRSQIVHGTTKRLDLPTKEDGAKYTLQECCARLEDYLRSALKKALELAQNPSAQKYLIDWDSLIFQPEDDDGNSNVQT